MLIKFGIAKSGLLILLMCLCGSLSAQYAAQVQSDAPVAWWRFDDFSYKDGLTATEATGSINAATYQGDAMTVAAGIGARCGWFNGNKAGVDIGATLGTLIDQSSAVTVEMWLKNSYLHEGFPSQRLFATRINGGQAGIDISLAVYTGGQGYISVGVRSIASDPYMTIKSNFLAYNQWAHLVCVIDYPSDSIKVYINGALAHQEQVDFASSVYVFGTPTQADQIGRSPLLDAPYRGYLDEVAVYNKALTLEQIQTHHALGNPAPPQALWISQIANDGAFDGPFLGSPSIHKFQDGTIVATHDYFGSNKPVPTGTAVTKISYNNGLTWWPKANITGVVMASLFEHNGALYAFGISRNPGHITIAKSTNYGTTWTSPTDSTNGLLFAAQQVGQLGYHTGPVPVLIANGRVYRVFELADGSQAWPVSYKAVIVSADVNANLLDAASWTMTNAVAFDPQWGQQWNADYPGWLEGNAVQAPDGSVVAVMRVNSDPAVDVAAIISLSADNTTLSFNPQTGFVNMPGGRNKFDIHRDPATGKYLTLNNNNTDPSRPSQRNTLSLIASDDLIHWQHIRTLVQDNSPMRWYLSMLNAGFQYVVWEFDGDDIIYISRTSYDGAHDFHDANKITFHRIENYQQFITECGVWGYLASDFNKDCVVDMADMAMFVEGWLSCTLPYQTGCVSGLQ